MNRKRFSGALAVGLTALMGLLPTNELVAQQNTRSWSIAVHLAYQDGSEYDIVLATGIPTREVPAHLAECGASHRTGSVVRYHCYPIPE